MRYILAYIYIWYISIKSRKTQGTTCLQNQISIKSRDRVRVGTPFSLEVVQLAHYKIRKSKMEVYLNMLRLNVGEPGLWFYSGVDVKIRVNTSWTSLSIAFSRSSAELKASKVQLKLNLGPWFYRVVSFEMILPTSHPFPSCAESAPVQNPSNLNLYPHSS